MGTINLHRIVYSFQALRLLMLAKKSLTIVIVTPSFKPDFERCQLLCQSIEQFVSPPVNHVLVVDRRDLLLFRQLENSYTEVVTVEELLPWWISRLPFVKKAWVSLRTPPIRNWLLQQIIKIQMARQMSGDVAVYIDSDVTFVRPFDFQHLVQGQLVRLYDEPGGNPESMADLGMPHMLWHQESSRLLGLPATPMPAPDYVGNLITWRKDNVYKMCDRIEEVSGTDWVQTLGKQWHLSEYTLYGTFVDRILGEDCGHYRELNKICHDYFTPTPLSNAELRQFLSKIHPDQVAVMIASKAGMPVSEYKHLLLPLANTFDAADLHQKLVLI